MLYIEHLLTNIKTLTRNVLRTPPNICGGDFFEKS